ncbi:MAG: hypothetical protein LBD31_06860 [Treponema sp.]|jgi:hypothetical protein|nr:hypothetical protein [Treponema sp.]
MCSIHVPVFAWLAFCAVSAPCGAQSLNAALNAGVFDSTVYTGISGRMSFREQERDYAKLHIAHQIAMNRKCVIDYGYIELEGTPRDDHAIYDSNIAYDDTGITEILERIVIVAEYRLPNCTVLAGRDSAAAGSAVYTSERTGTERPEWVRSTPEIEGYYTGVGFSDRYSELYKNILVADVDAAQTIAKEKNAYIRGFIYDHITGDRAELATGNVILSRAELYGLYIIDRWVAPDGVCYSLAAARKE